MSDEKTHVEELKQLVKAYRDERDWEQFHDPKNLAEDLVIEAGELLEHFLWKDKEQVALYLQDESAKSEVADELADALHCVLLLSLAMDIDLTNATKVKMRKNAAKYPVEKAKGKATKYTKL